MGATSHMLVRAPAQISRSPPVRRRDQPRNTKMRILCHLSGLAEFANKPGRGGACTFRSSSSARAPSKLHAAKQVSLKARLRSYGLAGVAAYGLLNTVYYITAFLFFWTHVAKVPRGLGLTETAKRFVGVMSLTWAGSQVTKVARIAAALALAPLLDNACHLAQQKLGLTSKRTALSLVVLSCIALASLCFGATVLVWA
ncbi:hypothetical protein WJX82_006232 [Trebouxia sp. C0006]